MSDPRRLRTDARKRHDGADDDPAHQPGTVKVFTVEEKKAMEGASGDGSSKGKFKDYPKTDYGELINERRAERESERRIVTAEETKEALERAAALSWADQKEQIRRATSILLSSVLDKIEHGTALPDEDVAGQLQKCSNIAKQWTAEERAGGGGTGGDEPTDAELMKRRGR